MVRLEIEGADATARMLRAVAPQVRTRLDAAIARLALRLVRDVKESKLSGQVLKNRTGRLRRSVNYRMTTETDTRIEATVGTNVEYARAHEYGGTVTIKEHLRMQTQAWGRPMVTPRKVTVKQHEAKFAERSFLRSALRELAPTIRQEIARAVEEGARR